MVPTRPHGSNANAQILGAKRHSQKSSVMTWENPVYLEGSWMLWLIYVMQYALTQCACVSISDVQCQMAAPLLQPTTAAFNQAASATNQPLPHASLLASWSFYPDTRFIRLDMRVFQCVRGCETQNWFSPCFAAGHSSLFGSNVCAWEALAWWLPPPLQVPCSLPLWCHHHMETAGLQWLDTLLA